MSVGNGIDWPNATSSLGMNSSSSSTGRGSSSSAIAGGSLGVAAEDRAQAGHAFGDLVRAHSAERQAKRTLATVGKAGTSLHVDHSRVLCGLEEVIGGEAFRELHPEEEPSFGRSAFGALRHLAFKILKRHGYTVLDAGNGEEALAVCARHKGDIHLMVTDVVMPNMNGIELAERLRSIRPETRVVYMSGYQDKAAMHGGYLRRGVNFIEKPFSLESLVKKVREMLDKQSEE